MRNKHSIPILILCLFLLSYLLYSATIHLFPSFIHAWTQSDRYAIALRFLDNGFDLFHPATFNYQTVEGVTRVDFPINEFLIAILMKIVGVSPSVFRIYTLCVSIIGLVFLYLLAKKITASEVKSWIVVFFVFLSPVYTYYQAGFVPSIPAIACVFAAYFYFFSYKESERPKQFILAIALFTLAALIRFPFVIFLFATLAQQAWMMLKRKKINKQEGLVLFSAFAIFGSYYLYNVHLGRIYGNMFLDSLMPAKSVEEFVEILKEIYHHWFFEYFTAGHYLLLILVLVLCTFRFVVRKGQEPEHKKYWFNLFILSAGTVLYFLMMSRQFYAHDYYFLDSLFVPTVFAFVFALNEITIISFKQKLIWGISFFVFAVFFFISNTRVQEARYITGPWDRTEITRQNFTGTERYLDSLGISKDAKILVIDAYTTNAPLILMNRKGYTVMGTTAKNIAVTMAWAQWDYIAIQDMYLVSDVIKGLPSITSMIERIGGNGKVSFYKKSEKVQPRSLKQFLGISKEATLAASEAMAPEVTDTLKEYGKTLVVKALQVNNESDLKALVSADFFSSGDIDDVQLVAAVTSGSEQIYYQNFMLKDYFRPSAANQKMEFQFVLPEFKTPEDEFRVYLWNPKSKVFYYSNWEVVVYK